MTASEFPPTRPDDLPYTDADRARAAEAARIADSETIWAEWHELAAPKDTNFAPTAPLSLPMPLPKGDPRYAATVPSALTKPQPDVIVPPLAVRHATVAEVMNEARRNNRVCPQPLAWQKLYEILPDKRQVEHGWEPSPPLTGSAWSRTPAIAKRMCLRDHIEWADRRGCLDEVFAFLRALSEDEWHHM